MSRLIRTFPTGIVLLLASISPARGQTVTPGLDIGFPEGGVFSGSDFDSVQLNNGNLHFEIPLLTIPGRGVPAVYKYVYDNRGWTFHETCGHLGICTDSVVREPGNNMGLPLSSPFDLRGTQHESSLECFPGYNVLALSNVVLQEPDGTKHHFLPDPVNIPGSTMPCNSFGSPTTMYADDGSGWILQSSSVTGSIAGAIRKDGAFFWSTSPGQNLPEDSNGNQLSYNTATGVYTDTLGRPISGPLRSSSPSSFTYYDSSGTLRTVQITYTSVSVQTSMCAFSNGDACYEYGGTWTMPYQITLPNNQVYTFTYVQGGWGEPASVTLPDGAEISWTWVSDGFYPGGRRVASRTVTVGGQSYSWTYTYNGTCDAVVRDPVGNESCHTFGAGTSDGSPLETQVKYFQGSVTTGQLIKTVQTDYQDLIYGGGSFYPVVPIRDTTTWNQTNQAMKTETDWDTYTFTDGSYCCEITWKNPIERREFAYGSGSPGPLVRRTDYNYLHLTNATYRNLNIANRETSKIVYDGSGTTVAQTTTTYDGSALTPTSGVVNHDYTNFSMSNLFRGNPTQASRWVNTTGIWLNTVNTYDDLGNLLTTTDPLQHTTSYSYTDNWANASCVPSGVNTHGYVTQVTNALNRNTQTSYYPCLGQIASQRDQNDINASRPGTTFSYDLLGRLTQKNLPDGGQVSVSYNDVAPVSVTTTTKINSAQNLISIAVKDGLGRTTETQLTSDPQGTVFTDTTYDALGRVATISNPYRSGSDITSTPGTTTFAYDALDRKISETYPDGSALTSAYCGSTTLVTDPTGRWRRSTTDALGRLIEVDEPNAPGATVNSNGCPGTGEPIWVTNYTYSTLGDLTQAVQNSSHQRNFTYDSLSRLLTAANPESGTTIYKYDSDTACPGLNSFPGLLVSKTDARGIRTCAQYEPLNRVTQTNYSNGDPTITYAYDQTNCLGLSSCDNIGRRTSMTDAAGSETWAYQVDPTNHRSVEIDQRTLTSSPNNITKTATYYLDLAGNVFQAIYPTGRVVNYAYDNANRPSSAADGSNGITYAAGFQTSPGGTCLNNVTCYTPQGTFYALSVGQSSSFTGLNLTHIYNSRLQPQEFKASSTGGNAIDVSYNFVDPVSSKNDGVVYGLANNLDSTRSQTFSYDQLNRITSALTTSTYSTSPSHCWGETYNVDTWGNLLSIAQTTNSAYTGCSQESGFSTTADGNNHLGGFGYDASGNTTNDTVFSSYIWNAESQLKSVNGYSYLYDGDGRRVEKVGSKLYWFTLSGAEGYGSGDEILAETDASGNTLNEYVYFGGKRIAMLPAGGSPVYYVQDMLGTSRVLATNTGVVCYDADFYPYGGERAYTNTCPQNNYKFAGKERDTETGNDDFGARYYSNRFGRWLSADWSSVPAPVPYANFTNPQTLNLYSMVADDPESFADLDGHCDDNDWCGSIKGVAVGTLNFVAHTAESFAFTTQALVNDPDAGVGRISQAGFSSLLTAEEAYRTQGVSGVARDVLAQGTTGATAIVTEAVLTGGLVASGGVNSITPEATVTRYMGSGEAGIASQTGEIPNTTALGEPKDIHFTTDKPMNSASAAKQRYELPETPTHRATVPARRVNDMQPAPSGPATSGGGSQAVTPNPIPVKPKEIKPLNP